MQTSESSLRPGKCRTSGDGQACNATWQACGSSALTSLAIFRDRVALSTGPTKFCAGGSKFFHTSRADRSSRRVCLPFLPSSRGAAPPFNGIPIRFRAFNLATVRRSLRLAGPGAFLLLTVSSFRFPPHREWSPALSPSIAQSNCADLSSRASHGLFPFPSPRVFSDQS